MPTQQEGPAPAAPAAELLSAILAEFRTFALRAAEEDKMISPESVLLLADKAEAAAEREREIARDLGRIDRESDNMARAADALEKAFAHGNAAAMRAALEYVCHMDDNGYTSYDVSMAVQKARDAISAPARNCDRCEFWEDLWGLEFVKLWPDVTDDLQRAWLFIRWLFAPAKGGDHA